MTTLTMDPAARAASLLALDTSWWMRLNLLRPTDAPSLRLLVGMSACGELAARYPEDPLLMTWDLLPLECAA